MDREIATAITLLRVVSHKSYGYIAEQLGISVNTVKSFCSRHGLGDEVIHDPKKPRKISPKGTMSNREPEIRYCLECGAAITAGQNGTKKFCSTLCANRWRRKHGNGLWKQICPVCGEEYPVMDRLKPRKYCSLDCYRTARYYTDNPERTVTVTCKTCGKEMTFSGHHLAKRKFCSRECYYRYLRTEDIKVQ